MNGQLLLLLISMLLQNPGGEVLPEPNRIGSQGFPSGLPANAPILPPDVAAPKHVRLAWHMLARQNLQNSAGLPVVNFRTDTQASKQR